ncbi:MAG: (d)CMP kinase [Xanthomonadales bacterium]|nr:(d)CMP kinase [Xanthomonadales bacterium]
MPGDVPVVTIDGPSGSGKGTVSSSVALALKWHFLDSGALYRLVGLVALRRETPLEDEQALARIARGLEVNFDPAAVEDRRTLLAGQAVDLEIRTEAVATAASHVAAIEAVREALLDRQRAFRQAPGLVADGRDMGTIVFPDAPCKIFLTASAEERAERRYKQLKGKGFDVNLRALLAEIRARDERDTRRKVAPLVPAADAVLVDTTRLTIPQAVDEVLSIASRQLNLPRQ